MDSSRYNAKLGTPNAGKTLGKPESLNDELTRMRNELNRELDALRSSLKPDPKIAEGRSATGVTVQLHRSAHPVAQIDVQSQVLPNGNEWVERDARFVLDSPYILTNPQYCQRVASTTFSYRPDDPKVNAYARDDAPDVSGIPQASIVLFGGLVTACHLASTALAAYVQARKESAPDADLVSLRGFLRGLGQEIRDGGGNLTHAAGATLLVNSIGRLAHSAKEQIHDSTQSYASAMVMSVVAHEAGHIALGHTLTAAELNYDTRRNQEREADSFAASVLSSSPFREYLFLGQVLVSVILCWTQSDGRETAPTTHPLARERFMNALRSNTSAAAEAADNLGMTSQFLEELLPDQ